MPYISLGIKVLLHKILPTYKLGAKRGYTIKCLRLWGFPGGTSGKESTCQCKRHERQGFDPSVGKSPGGGHNNLLQYSCLENSMDRRSLEG